MLTHDMLPTSEKAISQLPTACPLQHVTATLCSGIARLSGSTVRGPAERCKADKPHLTLPCTTLSRGSGGMTRT